MLPSTRDRTLLAPLARWLGAGLLLASGLAGAQVPTLSLDALPRLEELKPLLNGKPLRSCR